MSRNEPIEAVWMINDKLFFGDEKCEKHYDRIRKETKKDRIANNQSLTTDYSKTKCLNLECHKWAKNQKIISEKIEKLFQTKVVFNRIKRQTLMNYDRYFRSLF